MRRRRSEEGSFEQALHDGVAGGNIRNHKDLDNLNGEILDKYELFAAAEPELRSGWMKKRLLFEDPLYLVNYLYAALVACKLYEMDLADPKDFEPATWAFRARVLTRPAPRGCRKIWDSHSTATNL